MQGMLQSLRGRMLLVALFATGVLLVVLGTQLSRQFERHVERQQLENLQAFFEQLILSAREEEGRLRATLSDARFARPLSGYYWQINSPDGKVLARSRSLWDELLSVPPSPRDGGARGLVHLQGPGGKPLFALVQRVSLDAGTGMRSLVVIVAREHEALARAVSDFRGDLWRGLGLLAFLLLAALLAVIGSGLKPLGRLREQVMEVMNGRRRRVDVRAPRELRPLVEALNRLLDAQERSIARSRRRAAELAHGLKTPLAILSAHARDMEDLGHGELAAKMQAQVERMEQIVRHELARARLSGRPGGTGGTDADEALRRLIHALGPLMQERGIRCVLHVARARDTTPAAPSSLSAPPSSLVAIPEPDFLELFGNLLENACKWARSRVEITLSPGRGELVVDVRDDGPGVPAHLRAQVLEPGTRLDESREGQGLGLAIVRDIAAEHDLCLEVRRADLGGLLVRVRLPRAFPPRP